MDEKNGRVPGILRLSKNQKILLLAIGLGMALPQSGGLSYAVGVFVGSVVFTMLVIVLSRAIVRAGSHVLG